MAIFICSYPVLNTLDYSPVWLRLLSSFTELVCQDLGATSDAQAAAVVRHYGDPDLVVLVQALGLFNACARMSALLDFKAAEMLDADHDLSLL